MAGLLKFTRPIRFLVVFLGVYAVLEMLYFAVPDGFLLDVVYRGIVAASADVIRLITPQEAVKTIANRLQSGGVALEVVRGCDGAGVMFMLTAAMAASSAPLLRKLAGVLAATALVFLLNQVRIISLYYLAVYRKEWFLSVHVYFAPTLMIAVSGIYFAAWAMVGRTSGRAAE